MSVLRFRDFNWRQFNSMGRLLLRGAHLFDVFDLATIGSDLQVDWYWLRGFIPLGEVSKESISGAAISGGLWDFLNLYFELFWLLLFFFLLFLFFLLLLLIFLLFLLLFLFLFNNILQLLLLIHQLLRQFLLLFISNFLQNFLVFPVLS